MSTNLESQLREALREEVVGRTVSRDGWFRLAARRESSLKTGRRVALASTGLATVLTVVAVAATFQRGDPSTRQQTQAAVSATFKAEGITATVPPGWHARSLGTRMVATEGRAAIQLATFSFVVPAGAEDPILGMKATDMLVTVVPDIHQQSGASIDHISLSSADVITGGAVPRGRTVARRTFVDDSGIHVPFSVEVLFGKTEVGEADFARVNAVLAGIHLDPALTEPPTGSVTSVPFTALAVGTTSGKTGYGGGGVVKDQAGFDDFWIMTGAAGTAPQVPTDSHAMIVSIAPASCPRQADVQRVEVVELLLDGGPSSY